MTKFFARFVDAHAKPFYVDLFGIESIHRYTKDAAAETVRITCASGQTFLVLGNVDQLMR